MTPAEALRAALNEVFTPGFHDDNETPEDILAALPEGWLLVDLSSSDQAALDDGLALARLREALPEGWRGLTLVQNRYDDSWAVVTSSPYKNEACDHGYYHGEHNSTTLRETGISIADACAKALAALEALDD